MVWLEQLLLLGVATDVTTAFEAEVVTGTAGLWVHPETITPAMTSARITNTRYFNMVSLWTPGYIIVYG